MGHKIQQSKRLGNLWLGDQNYLRLVRPLPNFCCTRRLPRKTRQRQKLWKSSYSVTQFDGYFCLFQSSMSCVSKGDFRTSDRAENYAENLWWLAAIWLARNGTTKSNLIGPCVSLKTNRWRDNTKRVIFGLLWYNYLREMAFSKTIRLESGHTACIELFLLWFGIWKLQK